MIIQRSNSSLVRNFNDLRTIMFDFKISDKISDKFIEEYDALNKAHYDQIAAVEKFKIFLPVTFGVLILILKRPITKYLSPSLPLNGPSLDYIAVYNQLFEISQQVISIGFMVVTITLTLYILWLGYKFMTHGFLFDTENALLRGHFRKLCDDFILRMSKESGYKIERRTKISFKVSPLYILSGVMILYVLSPFFKAKPTFDNPLILTALIPILMIIAGFLSIKTKIKILRMHKTI